MLMKTLITFLLMSCSAFAVEKAELQKMIETKKALIEKNKKLISSPVTPSMMEGLNNVTEGLMAIAIKLEAELEEEKPEVSKKRIERDMEAVARNLFIEYNRAGRGGTIVKVLTADAVLQHIENRISYCVRILTEDDKEFDFKAWYKEWMPEEKEEKEDDVKGDE